MDHESIEKQLIVERYVRGDLSEAETEAFELHFLDCSQCIDKIEAAGELSRGLKQLALRESVKHRARRYILPLAAVLVGGLLLFAILSRIESGRLKQELARLDQPMGNALHVTLVKTRSNDDVPVVRFTPPPGTTRLFLSLEPDPPVKDKYRVRLLNKEGVLLWSGEDVFPDNFDALNIHLPAGFLTEGDYTLEAYGSVSQSPTRFTFRVIAPRITEQQ